MAISKRQQTAAQRQIQDERFRQDALTLAVRATVAAPKETV